MSITFHQFTTTEFERWVHCKPLKCPCTLCDIISHWNKAMSVESDNETESQSQMWQSKIQTAWDITKDKLMLETDYSVCGQTQKKASCGRCRYIKPILLQKGGKGGSLVADCWCHRNIAGIILAGDLCRISYSLSPISCLPLLRMNEAENAK